MICQGSLLQNPLADATARAPTFVRRLPIRVNLMIFSWKYRERCLYYPPRPDRVGPTILV